MSAKRFLIMAGGTGGHIFPALATAQWLQAQGHSVHWLGARNGMECRLVAQHKIPLSLIDIGGLRGKGWLTLIKAPFRLVAALLQALKVLKETTPDCVLGMGGYVTGPGGLAAFLLRIPLVIHEQNAIAGTTNRVLAKLAVRVLEAFPGAFASKVGALVTGNPVRANIGVSAQGKDTLVANRPLQVLVVGGSLGARAINLAVPLASALLDASVRPVIRHQTGEKLLNETRIAYAQANVQADLVPFITDMHDAYAWADIVICRAGALTISELCEAGLGAILVPFPQAVDDHQTANAKHMTDAGAAILVPQNELTPQYLASLLNRMAKDPDLINEMAKCASGLARPNATEQVARICLEVCGG